MLLQGTALAESTNPCADAIADYCEQAEGPALHYCLAVKRNRIEPICTDRVLKYFGEHPEEQMPEAEEGAETEIKNPRPQNSEGNQKPALRKPAPQREGFYGTPNLQYSNPAPSNDSFDPYSNLRNQMQEYYSFPSNE